jgi:hypothetical protein
MKRKATTRNPARLRKGVKYDIRNLSFKGWTRGDGTPTDGYNVYDYFESDGTYLGPDDHRISPIVSGARKRNPAAAASEAYTDFHGRASEEVVTVQTKVHYHKHLAACGELRKLVIKPVGKLFSVTLSGFKKALLAFNEKRTQLFIEGGDQAVDLKQFGIKTPHETETLGEVRVIEYFTIKDHLGNEGGQAVYVHKFSKPYPVLIYNVLDQQLRFSGGSYKVLAEGIDK